MKTPGLFWVWCSFFMVGQTFALEYVAKDQVQALLTAYKAARPLSTADLERIQKKEWSCSMYGVRTRLQVERDVRLYHFTGRGSRWHNNGAQMVRSYELEPGGLTGRQGVLVDQIRVNAHDDLIAELSLSGTTVLAYSVCQTATTPAKLGSNSTN